MCILAIISAVNNNVIQQSTANVAICRVGNFSKDLGVFIETDTKLISAHDLNILLTHSCKHKHSYNSLRYFII